MSSGTGWASFQPDPERNSYFVEFTFTAASATSVPPILRGYSAYKNGLVETVDPGAVVLSNAAPADQIALPNHAVEEVSLNGGDGDMTAEGGTLVVKTLAKTESPAAIVTYMTLLLTPLSLIPALFVWTTQRWR